LRTWPPSPFQVPLNLEASCAINMNAVTPIATVVTNITFFGSEQESVGPPWFCRASEKKLISVDSAG